MGPSGGLRQLTIPVYSPGRARKFGSDRDPRVRKGAKPYWRHGRSAQQGSLVQLVRVIVCAASACAFASFLTCENDPAAELRGRCHMTCQDVPGSARAGQGAITSLVPFTEESPGSARHRPEWGLTNSLPIGPSGVIRQACPAVPVQR